MQKYKNLSRRQLLSLAGGAGAVPVLWPFVPRLEAAEAEAKQVLPRFSYWYEFTMPHNLLTQPLYQSEPGPLAFKESFAPLNQIAEKSVLLRNIDRLTAYPLVRNHHETGAIGITGWRPGGEGKFSTSATSVDQWLAEKIGQTTPVKDLRAGWKNVGRFDVDISMSVVDGEPQERFQDPLLMYEYIFRNTFEKLRDIDAYQQLQQRKSILDVAKSSLDKLKTHTSARDAERMEAHEFAIREVEQKINIALANSTENIFRCLAEKKITAEAVTNEQHAYPIYSQLMTIALACNLTRIAGAHYGNPRCNLHYEFVENFRSDSMDFHRKTHRPDKAYLYDVLKFRAQSIVEYVKMLDAVIEPDGSTLLDNTLFYWTNDMIWSHKLRDDGHCFIAGAKNRIKRHGEMIATSGLLHNDILTTIAHYMGETSIEKYGDRQYCNGVLPSSYFG